MPDATTVERLCHHWHDGWNGEDLEMIMAPFAEGVVFSSPFVPRITGDPAKATIEGHEALRAYLANALARTPGIRYELHGTYVGADGIVLVYTAVLPNGTVHHGADWMRVDPSGQVTEWRCHYTVDPGA
jgi:hypothetical protein